MRRCCVPQGEGGDLVAAAAALSVVMAQGKMAEELELLAALFEIIGDNLALLALKAPSRESCCSDQCMAQSSSKAEKQDRCP